MLTLQSRNNKGSNCFLLMGMEQTPKTTRLITSNISLIAPSLGGEDICTFLTGPSDASIMAYNHGESAGTIAYKNGGESAGTIAYGNSGESAGTIASSGGVSYSASCFTAASCGGFSGCVA